MNKNWEMKKLGDVLQETETINPTQNPDKEFIYIDVSSVNNENFSIENTTLLKGKDAPSRARKLVKTNDIIFATVRPTLRRICIITDEYDNQVCSTGYFVLRAKESINYAFLFYYLLTDNFDRRMQELQKGTSYPAVTNSDVREQIIVYPKSLSEQQRIVSILDETFAAIEKAKENAENNLQNSRELFELYLQSVFSNPRDEWEEKKLREVCNFVRGPFGGSLKKSCFKPEGIAVYEQQHAIYNQFERIRYFIDEEKFNEMKRFEVTPGDLIMSCSGTMGKVAIVPEGVQKGIINQALLKLSPNKNIFAVFLKFWMESANFQEQITKYSQGAAIQNVASVNVLKEIEIPLPPLSEQRSIIAKIDALSAETKRLEEIYLKKLAALDELKKSVLQKAFNGELAGA